MEDEPNRTRNQPQLPTTPVSQPPFSKESPHRDCQEATGNCKTPKRPIAHLVAAGKLVNLSIRWKSSGRESTLQGMICTGEAIVIPARGVYYVYSQVSFAGGGCQNGSEVLENTVLYAAAQPRGRRQHPLELMQTTQTACPAPSNKPWYHSLHQGGAHWLEKNTHLSVKIRPLQRAELEHHKTYFGAFKLQ